MGSTRITPLFREAAKKNKTRRATHHDTGDDKIVLSATLAGQRNCNIRNLCAPCGVYKSVLRVCREAKEIPGRRTALARNHRSSA